MMMCFYSAQIHLRKLLNRVYMDLYNAQKQGQMRWLSVGSKIEAEGPARSTEVCTESIAKKQTIDTGKYRVERGNPKPSLKI
ncbi:hypothetical protein NUU61_001542 [Penicillium alfredii]|uniref:Uncharacterized protein n=1 Tax=Penicillium alfredii TaxID=1506179 RepID=A0A9W9G4M6_9EURO|nr:uncharacterized protein NUU61_001542 [Penicillium alfredii]KAJ5111912.1 hypothetical protein NUU61_001542 [Penicillium alfredii]